MPHPNLNLNPGLEILNAYDKYFQEQENRIQSHIDEMSRINADTKVITDFMNKLAHAKRGNEKADFTNDDEAQEWMDHIHNLNPTIFGQKRCVFEIEEIDVLIQGLDAEIKRLSTRLNEEMLLTSDKYQQRSQMTENAHKSMEMLSQHNASITRKMGQR